MDSNLDRLEFKGAGLRALASTTTRNSNLDRLEFKVPLYSTQASCKSHSNLDRLEFKG